MGAEVKSHPAAEMFPLMTGEDLRDLADDIKVNGLLEPIITLDNMILDGRNRYTACGMVAVPPRLTAWDGRGGSPTLYVVAKNLHRRHLTIAQRAAIGVEMLPLLQEEAKKRQEDHRGTAPGRPANTSVQLDTSVPGRSREKAAAAVQVSSGTMSRATAVKNADPEAFEKLKRGESTVSGEYKKLPKAPPKRGRGGGNKAVKANAHKRRMIDGLSTIGGACSALQSHVDVAIVRDACTGQEIDTWATKAAELSSILRKFGHQLRGESNNA